MNFTKTLDKFCGYVIIVKVDCFTKRFGFTDKQRDVIDLYYNEDLSLAEIAEHESITRQGVRDSIKRGEQTLFELEAALGLAEKSKKLIKIADSLEKTAQDTNNPKLKTAADEIRNIL